MEDLRMLVQEEGRAARNLIAFHVDLAAPSAGKSMSRKPPSSPRLLNEATMMTKRSSLVAKTGSRVRSASTGRDKKSEMQARYWALLLDNLQRAVDELYQTCDMDESVSECKEVILYLENFTREFHKLIEWFRLKWEYENTPPPQRPTSLAWEVRKSSPGKLMTQSRIVETNQTGEESPVKKQLNFFSGVKLSSTEDCPKKPFTLENELSNKYGLSFGDLEEHLQTVNEVSNLNNQHTVKIPDRVEENNKENCLHLMENGNKNGKSKVEIASSNQASQTEDFPSQMSKVLLKSNSNTPASTAKIVPPPGKVAPGSVGKNSTLSPLSISKSVSMGPVRKTMPISPTSTVPPRTVIGRNVAAVTFVSGKKLGPTCQSKVNTNLNRSTNNLSKTTNIPNQPISEVLDTNKLMEQEKVTSNRLSIDNCVLENELSLAAVRVSQELKNVNHSLQDKVVAEKVELPKGYRTENSTINGIEVKNTDQNLTVKKLIDQQVTTENLKNKSNQAKNDVKLIQSNAKIDIPVHLSQVPDLKESNSQEKLKTVEGTSVGKGLQITSGEENKKAINYIKPAKSTKVDKQIQTDLSHLAEIAAAKEMAKARASALVRTKTAPSLTRKSNETLASNDSISETLKSGRNIVVNQTRPAVKKQTSVNDETSGKTDLDKQILQNPLNVCKTTCSLPKLVRTPGTKSETQANGKHAVEKVTNEKGTEQVIVTNNDFPPLKSRLEPSSENLLEEKQSSEKASSAKTVNYKATSAKPVCANGIHDKQGSGKLTNEKSTSTSLAHEDMPKEKQVCEKTSSEKSTNTNLVNVSKVNRSKTAIELRPMPIQNRTLVSVEKLVTNENVPEQVIITNDDFPPLKSRLEPSSEELLEEKQSSEKASSAKTVNYKATSAKPVCANGIHDKQGSGKLTNVKSTSTSLAHEDKPKEKQVCEKLSSEKSTNTNLVNVSKVYRSNTAIELRPRPIQNRTLVSVEKLVTNENVPEQVIITNDDFPPLKSRLEPSSEKLLEEKQSSEKASTTKTVNYKATSAKPVCANGIHDKQGSGKLTNEKSTSTSLAHEDKPKEKQVCEKSSSDKSTNTNLDNVSKVYRSNTAIELRPRPRPMQNRTLASVGKFLTNVKQTTKKTPDERRVNTKPVSDKVSNVKPTITPTTPKIYRSSTSIELRPRVSFHRNVASATVKSEGRENQMSKMRITNSAERNPSLLKKSRALFKSEQNLQKKSSIDEDGWETVKGRNRWKLSQSSINIKVRTPNSRFHLPSPATSLPSLALASESPDPKPAKLHKDRQNQEIAKANRVALENKVQSTPKQNIKKKSDSVSFSLEKNKNKKDDEIEKKTVTREWKKVSNERVKDVKVVNGVKLDGSNKIEKFIDVLSSEDERMNEEEIRKSRELYEKERKLTKEIQDLEDAEIEVDTETDDAETDGETNIVNEEDDTNCRINAIKASYEDIVKQLSWADQMDTLEKFEKLIASDTSTKGIPYAERISTLEQLEELVARHPGRALELHQKLSSPSRRRHLPDTIQRHRERQESAQMKREQLLQDKTNKMRELLNKVEEVQKQQAQLKEDRKKRIAEKLKRAEENRALHIRNIQRKAHDEEEKLKEIMFINNLEAQNKRHDFIASCQEKEGRLQGIHDERQRKQEEKAAKEAAVEERRRLLEAERQERLEKMQEKRRKREERIGREQQEKEKERQELAREKARDHQERRQALQATQQANTEELQKKIQQKQVDSARRHEENIEHIRQRALECGSLRGVTDDEAPPHTPYDTYKLCVKCNVLIESEVYLLSHLRGKAHQEAVKDLKDDSEPIIIDAPPDKMDAKLAQDRERQKSLRKRCKKIRSRMAQRGEAFLSELSSEATKKLDSPNKMRLLKCLRNVDKQHSSQGQGQWPDNAVTLLERNLSEIIRMLDKHNEQDQKVFKDLNGFTTLSNVLNLALDIPKNMSPYLPPKCFLTACTVYSLACINHPNNSRFVIFSNKIALVLDLLLNRLNTLITDDYRTTNKSSSNLPVDPVAGALMKLFADVLFNSQLNVPADEPDMAPRLQDIISYTVSVGVVDKLALYCSSVRDPVDDCLPVAQFLHSAIRLLTMLAQTKCALVKGDPTQLVATLRVTELVGGVSMMYGMLLHQAPLTSPPALSQNTVWLTQATLNLLKAVALLDLNMFQSVLGAEGISLQLRHIASYLLWYCCHPRSEDTNVEEWLDDYRELLHQVIEVVGYFAVNHYDNQMMLQSGHMPTVLQQLCNLPFGYFSDPSLVCHLLPTLLACCHGNQENMAILEQEVSYQLLEDFRNGETAKSNPLVQLIKK